jgi:hypothetical protein
MCPWRSQFARLHPLPEEPQVNDVRIPVQISAGKYLSRSNLKNGRHGSPRNFEVAILIKEMK